MGAGRGARLRSRVDLRPHRRGDLRDATWFASVPTLAAAACVTSTIRLGTLVASPNFRHPVPFARELLTLDDISGGRLTVGIGAGGHGWDATVLGHSPWTMTERQDRFAEFVELLDRLLTDRSVTFDGRYWSARQAMLRPGCVQQPRVPVRDRCGRPEVDARCREAWLRVGHQR